MDLQKRMDQRAIPNDEDLQPDSIDSMAAARKMFDGYDMGVAFADQQIGKIIDELKEQGLYEDTAIIISADHGENLGELWVYGDHQTADSITHNVPMIIRWPGKTDKRAGQQDERLIYNVDAAATTMELAGIDVPDTWDGKSVATCFENASRTGIARKYRAFTIGLVCATECSLG